MAACPIKLTLLVYINTLIDGNWGVSTRLPRPPHIHTRKREGEFSHHPPPLQDMSGLQMNRREKGWGGVGRGGGGGRGEGVWELVDPPTSFTVIGALRTDSDREWRKLDRIPPPPPPITCNTDTSGLTQWHELGRPTPGSSPSATPGLLVRNRNLRGGGGEVKALFTHPHSQCHRHT